ncbi:hypothetical protein AB833_30875 [Chromatiales bacterium (ex Bugula neritina AB1)]|nr:hypothetical protein AB833_30875 [Chromatiales bacterium (ex Bugula neritina AB1)]
MSDQSPEKLVPELLSKEGFSAYGDVIELSGKEPVVINSGNCFRYSDLAALDICDSGGAGISLFDATAYTNPLNLTYVERHPLGSQAFLPTSNDPYLVIVADDNNNEAMRPKVFITSGYQGVNYRRNTWHGVLTPIVKQSLFVVVDYIGDGNNLEEFVFSKPYTVDFSSLKPRLPPTDESGK